MRIGLMVISIGAFGEKGFYNLQEVGLAKALDKLCEEVKVFKLISEKQQYKVEKIEETEHATITYIPSKALGTNGVPNLKMLDSTLDMYICFSDTQIMFPRFYKWAMKNKIIVLPYVGVVKSHSTNFLMASLINLMFLRSMKIYKKCACLAKTPSVQTYLKEKGVENVNLIPVGLDLSLTKKRYGEVSSEELKQKYGYRAPHRILLFIGRLIEEKQPLKMIEIFYELSKQDDSYRLLMIGTGELKGAVEDKINDYKLTDKIQMMDRIPNKDIWELYCLADAFVNLNRQEIFGMAILEAMYYGCKVVAYEAPGPNLIIENKVSGYLVHNDSEAIEAISLGHIEKEKAVKRVCECFTWESTAKKIIEIVDRLKSDNYS